MNIELSRAHHCSCVLTQTHVIRIPSETTSHTLTFAFTAYVVKNIPPKEATDKRTSEVSTSSN